VRQSAKYNSQLIVAPNLSRFVRCKAVSEFSQLVTQFLYLRVWKIEYLVQ